MKNRLPLAFGLILVMLAISSMMITAHLGLSADSDQAATAPAATASTPPPVDPQVEQVFSRACALLSSHKLVGYHAEITFDTVLPSLVKLQYAAAMDVAIERPNRLAISYQSDLGAKRLWYDGKTLTILDGPHMAYASVAAPNSIDEMLDWAKEQKNLTIPLAGFNYTDPCGRVRGQIQRSKYIGLNDAGGIESDHLGFIGEEADWQLWIEHGKSPLPRKIVITYKKLPAEPQWEAMFSNWRFGQPFAASVFQPRIPSGAVKADFVELKKEAQK